MNLFCAVLGYAMAAVNLYSGMNRLDEMGLILGGLWLFAGIYYTVKYVKEIKQEK